MKLRDLIERTSLKAAGRRIGLDIQVVDGQLRTRVLDPDDPRYSMDFVLPSMRMVEACRTRDLSAFQPFIEAGLLTEAQMQHAAKRYHLGQTRSGLPMYWMIDEMLDPQDAHIADDRWLSTLLRQREPLLRGWHPTHCLYGQHLLLEEHVPQRPVAIVESEQSATVLSELFPETLWMAYATPEHLDIERFAPLAGRTVTFYPRTDPGMSHFLLCEELAADIRRHYGIACSVDSTLEEHATEEQRDRCIDILEFLRETV